MLVSLVQAGHWHCALARQPLVLQDLLTSVPALLREATVDLSASPSAPDPVVPVAMSRFLQAQALPVLVELWLSEAARELQLQVELSLFALQMQAKVV